MSRLVAGGVVAALGLLWGRSALDQSDFRVWNEAERRASNLMLNDRFEHLQTEMYDYSGNSTLDNIKHTILNPAHMWPIKIPLIYAQEIGKLVLQNIIPAAMVFSGTILAFGGSPGRVAATIFGGLGKGIGKLAAVQWMLTKTVWNEGATKLFGFLGRQMNRMTFRNDPKAQLALAAGLTVGGAMLVRFFNVFTGQAREDTMNEIDNEFD